VPPNLEELDCSCNDLGISICNGDSDICVFPDSLKKLICNSCNFTEIKLPPNLEHFECSNHFQRETIDLFKQLNKTRDISNASGMNCIQDNFNIDEVMKYISRKQLYGERYNLISSIDLPESLKFVDCSRNNLTIFPTLPKNITYFDCSHNEIRHYSSHVYLPEGLETLNIQGNNNQFVGRLGKLPKSLTVFKYK